MEREYKVAVVTGGSRGIGKAVSIELASRGMKVAIFARNQDQLDKTARDIQVKTSQTPLCLVADIGSMQSVQAAFKRVMEDFRRVDVLINAAGINIRKGIVQTTEEEWAKVIRTNLTGVFISCKIASGIMIAQKNGVIINISSVQARIGGTSPHYSASKAGIHGLTFALAKELAPFNIRVNAVAPGATDTDMAKLWSPETRERLKENTVLKRIAKPEEIAKAIAFLASEDASFITGTILDVNGGAWMG
jgi:3-oxoacyl-[acyl-carrier protein] reductase